MHLWIATHQITSYKCLHRRNSCQPFSFGNSFPNRETVLWLHDEFEEQIGECFYCGSFTSTLKQCKYNQICFYFFPLVIYFSLKHFLNSYLLTNYFICFFVTRSNWIPCFIEEEGRSAKVKKEENEDGFHISLQNPIFIIIRFL